MTPTQFPMGYLECLVKKINNRKEGHFGASRMTTKGIVMQYD